jgi:hypothetical protein
MVHCVSDTLTGGNVDREKWVAERDAVPPALEANRERRTQAEMQAARAEMSRLLARGQAVALDVAPMARAAGVSRDTAHRLLRETGSVSHRELHRRAREAAIPQGEPRAKWLAEQQGEGS